MSSKVWHARPLGAYRLASELRDQGYNVLVIDFFSKWLSEEQKLRDLLKAVISQETIALGYSSTFFSKDNHFKDRPRTYKEYHGGFLVTWPVDKSQIADLNQWIKTLNPAIKILYGGAAAGNINDQLTDCGVDYVVQGLADNTIREIMTSLQDGKFLRYSPKNGLRVIDHDTLAQNFDFANSVTRYHPSDCFDSDEVLPLETSRGCLFKCSFCAYPLLGRKKNDPAYHKHFSVLAQEIKNNYENHGVRRYMFVDDTFNESTEKLLEIKQAIIDSGINISFSCYLRLDLLHRFPEQIQILSAMGLQSCFLGIETLNTEAMKSIGKKSDQQSVQFTLEHCRQIWNDRVAIYGSFICGLPHETETTVNDWMSWIYDRSDIIDGFILSPLNLALNRSFNSDIGKDPGKYGYMVIDAARNQWINNQGLSRNQAIQISDHWMEKAWQEHRLKVSGWEMLGLQNLGCDFEYLKDASLDNLPFEQLKASYQSRFARYQSKLLSYIHQQQHGVNT